MQSKTGAFHFCMKVVVSIHLPIKGDLSDAGPGL